MLASAPAPSPHGDEPDVVRGVGREGGGSIYCCSLFLFAVIEVLRRCLWIFLRCEHQYLRDEKGYRARLARLSEFQAHDKLDAQVGHALSDCAADRYAP